VCGGGVARVKCGGADPGSADTNFPSEPDWTTNQQPGCIFARFHPEFDDAKYNHVDDRNRAEFLSRSYPRTSRR
jgi:hypothetical protein